MSATVKRLSWFILKSRERALSVSEYSTLRGVDFQGISVYRSDEDLEAAQGTGSGAAIYRLDEPTTSIGLNFRMRRNPGEIQKQS
ncbi:MAG TPA: hypothetical protein VGR03_13190 [Candidatus Acidoferrum sp.]|nr:hypothetical protein [Candidatus Acidoferrum sp.]